MWSSQKELKKLKNEPLISYYCRCTDFENMPGKIHFPYWAKKGTTDITVVTMFDKYLAMRADFELVCSIDDKIEDVKAGLTQKASSSAGHGEQPKDKKKPGQHGGWMPRCARLVKAIREEDWDKVREFADMCYEFANMKEMVDSMR